CSSTMSADPAPFPWLGVPSALEWQSPREREAGCRGVSGRGSDTISICHPGCSDATHRQGALRAGILGGSTRSTRSPDSLACGSVSGMTGAWCQTRRVWHLFWRSPMPTTSEKRAAFRRLHESGCFVIPNPWDVGSTLYLQSLGFKALATTSAGFAWAAGFADGGITRDLALKHFAELATAANVPLNADFEGGFADAPEDVAESVRLCVATGVSGLSIEDCTGEKAKPLYDFDLAVARIKAARAAIDKAGGDVILTGRSEGFIRGKPDMDETVRRLKAYSAAGADCLYAP